MQNYSTTNAQQGIADMNNQNDGKLPQPEEKKREEYRACKNILATESAVEFSKEKFKYQGGEPLLQKFKDDTERIIKQHPKRVALLKIWNGESLWETNLPYVVIPEILDPVTGLVVQPETGVRPKYREWPAKKVLANGSVIPHTPEQKRWIEYVQHISVICSDPTKPIKLGQQNVHAYTDINVTNLCKTAHSALASILIDRCDLAGSCTNTP